jgi:hypothetical protein
MLLLSSGLNNKPIEHSILTLLDCLAFFLTVTAVRTSNLKIKASINALIARCLKRGVKLSPKCDDVQHGCGVISEI